MKRLLPCLVRLVPGLLLWTGFTGAPVLAAGAAPSVHSITATYTCQDGQQITADYIQTGTDLPGFVLLTYQGRHYGLVQAVSASGARYASRYGPRPADPGLEWWEHQGEATLSAFNQSGSSTSPLLQGCRPH